MYNKKRNTNIIDEEIMKLILLKNEEINMMVNNY